MIQNWEVAKDKESHFESQNWLLILIPLLQAMEKHILMEGITL